MGVISKFGKDDTGSLTNVDVIAQFVVKRSAEIKDFKITAGPGTAGTIASIMIQPRNTDNPSSAVEVDRLELPTAGDAHSTYDQPIRVTSGQKVKVVMKQDTIGRMSALILGESEGEDIADI